MARTSRRAGSSLPVLAAGERATGVTSTGEASRRPVMERLLRVGARVGRTLRAGAGAGPSPVPELLAQLLHLSADGAPAGRLNAFLTAVCDAGLARRCELSSWNDDGRAELARRQVWSGATSEASAGAAPTGGGRSPEEPLETDLPVRHRGRVLGHLRCEPPPSEDDPDRWAALETLAKALGLTLHQARTVQEVAGVRRDATAARRSLADVRQRTAVRLDEDRRTLERDLHDGVQGDVVALTMHLSLVELALDQPLPPGVDVPTPDDLLAQAHRMRDRLDRTAAGLAPPELIRDGLAAALRTHLPGIGNHVRLEVSPTLLARRYPPDVEAAVFFVCCEAVVNARKHASGADVDVCVEPVARGVLVTVQDSGPGFDGPAPPGAFRTMRERIGAISGSLDVTSSVATGTRVTATVPC